MHTYKNLIYLFSYIFFLSSLIAQPNSGSMFGANAWILDQYAVNPSANPSVLDYNGTGLTLEAWIFPISLPESEYFYPSIVERSTRVYLSPTSYSSGPRYGLKIKQQTGYYIEFVVSNGNDGTIDVSLLSSDFLKLGVWTHIAATYDGSMIKLYINGILDTLVSYTNSIIPADEDAGFGVGSYGTLVDDVRLWNIVRTPAEINDNKGSQLNPDIEASLVGYWPFNEMIYEFGNNITKDSTANENDLITGARFVNTTHLSEYNADSSPHIEENFNQIEFPAVETGFGSSQKITITNSGDSCLYGKLNATGPKLTGSNSFFVDGNSSYTFNIYVSPFEGGVIEESMVFEEGNASNLGLEIPVEIEAINLQRYDANNITMWINRDGNFAHNKKYQEPGFEWPKGENKHVAYASGVWIGAQINGETHTSISSHSNYNFEFTPGQILETGEPDNPAQVKYRVYKIDKNSGPGDKDYDEWPGHEDAPAGDMGAFGTALIINQI